MEPANIRFGGGAAGTVLHPAVAAALLITIVLVLLLPRKYALVPWLSMAFLTPFAQVVVVGGVHFTVYRIVALVGLLRLGITKSPSGRLAGRFNSIDRVFLLWAFSSLIIFSAQWMQTPALIRALGNLVDALGGYFALRFLIQDRDDLERAIKVLAVVAMIVAAGMLNEQFTSRNVFGLLGGMPLGVAIREGKARSNGPFEVYLTAGAFGATLVPLLVWLWSGAKARMSAALGLIGATVVAITSNTSTSLLAYAGGVVGLCFWPLRKRMRAFRWSLVLTLLALHLVMKAPVWALIARIDLTGSSSGFHRYMLVDGCIRHFSNWWLLGVKDYDTWGWDMWDLCNQYVAYAFTGGLLTLVLFISVISRAFGRLGTARKAVEGDVKAEWFLWCLCAAVLSHVVAYFGIGYYDQIQVAWYALLAIVSAAVLEATPVAQAQKVLVPTYPADAAEDWQVLETNH